MVRRTFLLVLAAPLLCPPRAFAAAGPLVAVGGGSIGPEIVAATLQLSGGGNAVVAVLPQSSAEPDAGHSTVDMWRQAGAREAAIVAFDDRTAAAVALRRATLIWIPGGDQNRFMKAIAGTGLDDVIRERHRSGVTVGGTSA